MGIEGGQGEPRQRWRWRLTSPVAGRTIRGLPKWEPGEAFHATCQSRNDKGRRRRHRSPNPRCRCGIYASPEPDGSILTLWAMSDVMVVGEVALWGRVVVCERGWRAEYAYAKRLSLFTPPWRGETGDERLQHMYDDLHDYRVPVDFSELVMEWRPVPSPLTSRAAG